ncbi:MULTISPECIES: DUF4129 domain-containing protein [Saccharibacillus]|uniref:DUF4129 domain-containing protein n=1 Tax=Saccharibacillus TaxID=456492 RepID=UPI00123AD3E3|nr:DUF4129 domain-containing protein [Saccharibacillus sp. WB 17]MWJ31031.1 DUF4129 domain-containing protein [Saccharibacillus sp. WB 17]
MNRNLFKALETAIRDTALFYPLLLLLSLYVFDLSPYVLAGLFGLCLMAGAAAAGILGGQRAYAAALVLPLVPALLVLAWSAWLGLRIVPLLLLLCAAGVRGVYRLNGAVSGRRDTPLVFAGLLGGIVVYTAALRPGLLEPYAFSVYTACTVTLLVQLLRWNERRVREAMGLSQEADLPSGQLLRMNRSFMAALLLSIVLIGGATQLSVVLEWLYRFWLFLLYGGVDLDYVPEPPPIPADPASPDAEVIYDLENEAEAGLGLDRWIIYGVALIALLSIGTAVFFLLRLLHEVLSEWLPDWLKRLLQNLRIAAKPLRTADGEAYADTTEKLGGKPSSGRAASGRAASEPSDPNRRAYFRLVRAAIERGYAFRPWLTPSETAKEIADKPAYREQNAEQVQELVERYNRSRYTK